MPIIEPHSIAAKFGSDYPSPFDEPLAGRGPRTTARAAGITDFDANHAAVRPGSVSRRRHGRENEDELVIVVSGTAILVEGDAETRVRAGGRKQGMRARRRSSAERTA